MMIILLLILNKCIFNLNLFIQKWFDVNFEKLRFIKFDIEHKI